MAKMITDEKTPVQKMISNKVCIIIRAYDLVLPAGVFRGSHAYGPTDHYGPPSMVHVHVSYSVLILVVLP